MKPWILRGWLSRLVEQPEPTVDGDCLAVDLDALLSQGVQYLEFHYDDDEKLIDVIPYDTGGNRMLRK